MLRGLAIRDMLIIERLDLEFQPGLNVLTGETGAGKSILLDSLGFVLGWRGRADLVRSGADHGEVTAVFELEPEHPVRPILDEAGLDVDEDELVLRRQTTASGRKKAWVNDRRVSGDVLRQLSGHLVELHGQHDDRGLMNVRGHRDILDAYGETDNLLTEVRTAWQALRAARDGVDETEQVARFLDDEAFLRASAEELGAAAPEPDEVAKLDEERQALKAAAAQVAQLDRVRAVLADGPVQETLLDAIRVLEGEAAEATGPEIDTAVEALGAALDRVETAGDAVTRLVDASAFDAHALDRVEARRSLLADLARKFRVREDELHAYAVEVDDIVERLDGLQRDRARALARLAEAEAAWIAATDRLTAERTAAAAKLDVAVAAELAPLRMERAVFETAVTAGPAGPSGVDEVAFTVATNPGAPPGPLARIASGGELSRFLLALKVCLSERVQGRTMIFDEIDRGVGGATADAVGRRLQALSSTAQVLVVTHSPQVAALGGHHWRVEKQVRDNQTTSSVVPLNATERIDEVARMLAGDSVTDAARAAAKALLAG